MKPPSRRGSTLLELMVAIIIFSMLALTFAVIEVFAHFQVFTTDRRAKTQNALVYAIEHTPKQIARTIGNPVILGTVIDAAGIVGDTGIRFYVDAAADYISPGDGIPGTGGDHWRAYRFRSETAFPSTDRFQYWYCSRCTDSSCATCTTAWGSDILASRITDVSYGYDPGNNFVEVAMTACWDPQKATTSDNCGTPENPTVSMKTLARTPSVSVR